MRHVGIWLGSLVIAFCAVSSTLGANCSVEAFFVSPTVDGVVEQQLLSAFQSASSSIYVAMYSFTDNELGAALVRAHERGVEVRILLDSRQPTAHEGQYPALLAAGIPIGIEHNSGSLHDKFAVIDSSLVVTGSYNWSGNANDRNFENVVFITCTEIASQYAQEFFRMAFEIGLTWRAPSVSALTPPVSAPCYGAYVASTDSKVFHCVTCFHVKSILPVNAMCFGTREEALAYGCRPCSDCKP